MKVEDIAKVCHDANRAYCAGIGDFSQKPWDDAEQWQREAAVTQVRWRLENPEAPASTQHESWMTAKLAAGWKFGPVKSTEKKEHPSLVPFAELPAEERAKDVLFNAVVDALKATLE